MYRVGQQKVCPRLRDIVTTPAGGITQPRTNFFGQLCMVCCWTLGSSVLLLCQSLILRSDEEAAPELFMTPLNAATAAHVLVLRSLPFKGSTKSEIPPKKERASGQP